VFVELKQVLIVCVCIDFSGGDKQKFLSAARIIDFS
jgi:hypothetical protein